MEYRPLDQIAGVARDASTADLPHRLTRKQRLNRWAEVLEQEGERHLQPLRDVEFVPAARRRALRADQSALAAAFEDPVLRSDGLAGDTLGDGVDFFGLSHNQAHHILCACHYAGRPAASLVARRVRHAARPLFHLGMPYVWLSLSAAVLAAEAAVVMMAV